VLNLFKLYPARAALFLAAVLVLESAACNVSAIRTRLDAAEDRGADRAPDGLVDAPEIGQTGGSTGANDSGPDGRDGGPDGRDGGPDGRDGGPDGRDNGPDGRDAGAADLREAGVDLRSDRTDASDAWRDAGLDASGEAPAWTCAGCTTWGTPVALGTSPAALPELSGLASSHAHPGLLYSHNDSGDSARFFALTEQGHVNAEIRLTGATATDWEDISVGPCPTGSCVYIGDTGDNKLERTSYVIHRVAEPATLPTDGGVVEVIYESFPFVYPDGPHNAESLLVHPTTGQIFVILKESGIPAGVYEMPLPLKADQQVTLTWVATLAIPPVNGAVTDGAFHPCGDRILVRTTGTTGLFEMSRTSGQPMSALFGASPVMVPVAVEPQGEAVTYSLDGKRYITGSETVSGSPVPSISAVSCQSP
jgi:hypothetical protein